MNEPTRQEMIAMLAVASIYITKEQVHIKDDLAAIRNLHNIQDWLWTEVNKNGNPFKSK